MMWGVIKFSKRIIRPHAVTNNEVLDLLSRIPDDEELVSEMLCCDFHRRGNEMCHVRFIFT